MRFADKLIISENITEKKDKIIKRIQKKKPTPGIYLLCQISGNNTQLEIISTSVFLQTGFEDKDIFVCGISKGYFAAIEIIEELAKKVYVWHEAKDIKSYLLQK